MRPGSTAARQQSRNLSLSTVAPTCGLGWGGLPQEQACSRGDGFSPSTAQGPQKMQSSPRPPHGPGQFSLCAVTGEGGHHLTTTWGSSQQVEQGFKRRPRGKGIPRRHYHLRDNLEGEMSNRF